MRTKEKLKKKKKKKEKGPGREGEKKGNERMLVEQ